MTLEKVLGVSAVRRWLYLPAKPSHVGVDVDGLACPLHHPMTFYHALSCLVAAMGGDVFLGDVKPPSLDI
jgi:hypothetical protein